MSSTFNKRNFIESCLKNLCQHVRIILILAIYSCNYRIGKEAGNHFNLLFEIYSVSFVNHKDSAVCFIICVFCVSYQKPRERTFTLALSLDMLTVPNSPYEVCNEGSIKDNSYSRLSPELGITASGCLIKLTTHSSSICSPGLSVYRTHSPIKQIFRL